MEYVLIIVERPHLGQPWGLTLLLDGGHLQVSNPHCHLRVGTVWRTASPRTPDWWWQFSNETDRKVALKHFTLTHSWARSALEMMRLEHVLLSVNGQVLAGPCQDLRPVTEIFKKSLCLNMLLLRPMYGGLQSLPKLPTVVTKTLKSPPTSGTSQAATGAGTSSARPSDDNTPIVLHRNKLFSDPQNPGLGIPFVDDWEDDPEEGRRAELFLVPIPDVQGWIQQRKRTWRTRYHVYPVAADPTVDGREVALGEQHVPVDFWKLQGWASYHAWLQHRRAQWRHGYSWQRAKRRRIEEDVENSRQVNLTGDFVTWLRVRKTQWRLARRQKQRALLAAAAAASTTGPIPSASLLVSAEVLVMDKLLEEKEEKERLRKERPPLDISWLFDTSKDCPDDVVAHCMQFLPSKEHGKLLALNRHTRKKLAERDRVWRLLCPPHWNLPRRPRQPWHMIYWATLQREDKQTRKIGDDLLSRSLEVVAKGDHLSIIEKMVAKAEKDAQFSINYCSGVVCERNSLLNLAILHQRHKIVRWLVEVKGADIESEDRGRFTPLLNAAWDGDKSMVRFLLGRGANRKHIGMSHYTRPLAPPDFEGKTAAEWAEFRGHHEVAQLIRLGL